MAAYEQMIHDKLTSMFDDGQRSGDWGTCWQRVSQLVNTEKERSFKNGVRWAKQNRVGRFPVKYQVQRGNDEVVNEEIEAQA